MNRAWLLLPFGLLACDPWDNLPDQSWGYVDEVLWDTDGVAAADGLYLRLPYAGDLVRVSADGSWQTVDLDGASPTRLVAAPDGESVLVFAEWPSCDSDDDDIETVEDCWSEEDALSWNHELAVVRGGERINATALPVPYNALTFTNDGSQAVAYLDFDADVDLEIDGVLNLTEALFIDLASGDVVSVPVGFSANNILFTEDATGAPEKAVVLSRSQVVVVELQSGSYETLVTYNLTLDVDDTVEPVDVALTPDGDYALIPVRGSGDLYILNLVAESINIVSLPASPSDMSVNTESDRTALVYANRTEVDVLEHDYFSVTTIDLDEPATDVLDAGSFALLYNTSGVDYHDVYMLDYENNSVVEFRAENPVTSLHLAPDTNRALALLRPEGGVGNGLEGYYDQNYGLEILDLDNEDNISLVSESEPLGVAFAGGDALLLLEGVDDLLQLDLENGDATYLPLEAPPASIGAFGADRFYITHDSPLGLVTFLNPETGATTVASGFAAAGLLETETPLPRLGEE